MGERQERGTPFWGQCREGNFQRVNSCAGILEDDERCFGEEDRICRNIDKGKDAKTFAFGDPDFDEALKCFGVT